MVVMPQIMREEYYDGVNIIEYEKFELDKPSFLVLGFPDAGLVGGISISHLIRELNAREVGGVDVLRLTPPIAIIKEGDPRPPLRLFHYKNLLLLAAEAPIPPNAIHSLSYAILEYTVKRRIDYILSLTGIGTMNRINIEKPNVFWAASGREAVEKAYTLGIKPFDNGVLIGPYAVILKDATRYRANNIVLLVESFPDLPDPEAASVVLEYFTRLTGVKVDVKRLLEEAELIRLKTKELMKRTAKVMSQMGKGMEVQPSLLYT
jgi:uncharacterized protein